jgi:mono/diheme cytochrome c family protein
MTSRLKKLAVAVAAAPLFSTLALISVPAQVGTEDAATIYKTKCFACHGPKADKRFDATLPEDQMLDTIMKGKKVEKPPNMPAYGEKGMTADQAKAMIAYMKSLKQ